MSFYDEVEIEDMEFDETLSKYFYPCPCGDRFQITLVFFSLSSNQKFLTIQEQLRNGEEVATCPSCTLTLRVIYDPVTLF